MITPAEEKIYPVGEDTQLKKKPSRAERRRVELAQRKDLKAKRQSFEAQLPVSYVLLKDGRQAELRRSMSQLKDLRKRGEAIVMVAEGGSERIAIPWSSIEKISSKQF